MSHQHTFGTRRALVGDPIARTSTLFTLSYVGNGNTNKGVELPLQELAKLPKLKKLILDGNPFEPAYVQQIRSTLSGIEVVRNEVVKPS